MQKKLIALAIAGAFVAPAAFADSGNVTIYGVMDASFDVVDSGDGRTGLAATAATAQGVRQNAVSSNSSRLGFKGSEDLGNGLAAVWQIESTINVDGGAGTALGTRNTFVGLSSKSMGTVVLGRHDTPYKLATRGLDVFGDGIADNRSIMGGGVATFGSVAGGAGAGAAASFDGRQSNVLAYISPTWNGFHAAIGYVTFENANDTAIAAGFNQNTRKQDNAWSLAGIYSNGPWFGSLAYERHNIANIINGFMGNTTNSTGEEHAWKLGVGYNANNFRVGVAYEHTNDDFGSAMVGGTPTGSNSLFGHNAWYLGGGYTFGNNEVKLAYTHASALDGLNDSGAKQWSIGLDHNFSKRTKVYALYTRLTNDNNGMYTLSGGSTAAGLGNLTAAYGTDPSAWSFGLRHSF